MNMLAHLHEWVVLRGREGPVVNLFAGATTRMQVGAAALALIQKTDYPEAAS